MYGRVLFLDEPRKIVRGDKILHVSVDSHRERNRTVSDIARSSIGHEKDFNLDDRVLRVRCVDAGMRRSEGLWAFVRRSETTYDSLEPPFRLSGYRAYKIWKVLEVIPKERQARISEYGGD